MPESAIFHLRSKVPTCRALSIVVLGLISMMLGTYLVFVYLDPRVQILTCPRGSIEYDHLSFLSMGPRLAESNPPSVRYAPGVQNKPERLCTQLGPIPFVGFMCCSTVLDKSWVNHRPSCNNSCAPKGLCIRSLPPHDCGVGTPRGPEYPNMGY